MGVGDAQNRGVSLRMYGDDIRIASYTGTVK